MNDDARLARAAASGDLAAFTVLVRRHQGMLRGFLRRLTRADFADDLAQETFLEAHRKIAQYRGDGSFAGWLCRIAYSRFLMALRARKTIEETAAEPLVETEPALIAKLDLEKAMAQLAPSERAALTLSFAMGFSHGEAAVILGVPLGTLKSHVQRGREKLQRLLGEGGRHEGS